MTNNYLILIIGMLCAGLGGECFVRGAVGLARWARISAGIIGATVAAFATSSPELTVSVTAALSGTPQIALGDALGSNVLNIALILGAALLLGDIHSGHQDIKRDFPLALFVPVIIGAMSLDGVLSQVDGAILLAIFLAWVIVATFEAHRQRSAIEAVLDRQRGWLTIAYGLTGLLLLIVAGRFIVTGAKGVAVAWGLDAFIIGAVIVSIGTTIPELATTLIARIKGQDELGLGVALGSNIFNGLFIIGVVAVLRPIPVVWHELVVVLLFGIITVALTFPSQRNIIQRWRGVILLLLYVGYLVALLSQ